MKRRCKRLLLLCLVCGLGLGLLRVSDSALRAVAAREDKPYFFEDGETVAHIGGLALSYAELRFHCYTALTEDLGLDLQQADLIYDEALCEQVMALALERAAQWRAVSLLALEGGLEAPEPPPEALARQSGKAYMTLPVAEAQYRAETLHALAFQQKYGPGATLLPDAEALAWAAEACVVRLRAIVLDANPAVYSEAEIQSRLEQARIFAAQLDRGETDFAALRLAYSEDDRYGEGVQTTPTGLPALYEQASSLRPGGSGAFLFEDRVWLLLREAPEASAPLWDEGEEAPALRITAAQQLWSAAVTEQAGRLRVKKAARWKRLALRYMLV